MSRRIKIVVLILVAAVVLGYLLYTGFGMPLTPSAPSAWHQIHVGMHRPEILQLVGPAQFGMYPEKIVETWQRDGALGNRRLVVWCEDVPRNDRATIVCEYVYWRPSRRDIDTRVEPLPLH